MKTASVCVACVVAAFAPTFNAVASCSSRPGTPNQLVAQALSSSTIELSWRNTTNKGMNRSGSIGWGDQKHTMNFDIYVRDQAGHSIGRDITGGARQSGLVYGVRSAYRFDRLAPNSHYCFAMRARTAGGTQGCISQAQSEWACVSTLAPGQTAASTFQPSRPPVPSRPPTSQPPAGCNVFAFTRVTACRNLDGSPSEYFSPITLEPTCGRSREEAEARSKSQLNVCYGDSPGCCIAQTTFGGNAPGPAR